MSLVVRPAEAGDVDACVGVLVALPEYFTPDTHAKVAALVGRDEYALVGDWDGTIVGFLVVERMYPQAAEITWAAVLGPYQGRGIGRALVDETLAALAADGVVVVMVKTLDASADYEPYVATRAFWEHRGFVQVDMIDPLPDWQPGNPAAIYVAALDATR